MRINEIKNKFECDLLEELLAELKSVFDEIDAISQDLSVGLAVEESVCIDYLSKLTGYYMYLNPILAEAKTQKKNNELRIYHDLKIQIENEGKKFISAPAEKEASLQVALYRRVRNIIESYVEACKIGITTCQSILKYFAEEKKMTGKLE